MPGFVNSDEQESRQSLYRDLLSHLNETIWGSPSKLPASASNQYTTDFNPAEAFDKSKNPEGAIFVEPEINWTESQIRGYPKAIAKAIRKVMQNEMKVRGKSPYNKTSGSAEAQAYAEELAGYKKMQSDPETFDFDAPEPEIFRKNVLESEESIASRLLRGTWYRGQEEYPTILGKEKVIDPAAGKEVEELVTRQFGKEYAGEAPTFMGMRASSSNVGEPHGISLSYDPKVSARFNAPETLDADKFHKVETTIEPYRDYGGATGGQIKSRVDKLASTTKVGRAMPLYGGPPEDKILMAWKPEHGAEFRSAYVEAAQEMMGKHKMLKPGFENLEPGASGEAIKDVIDNSSYYDPKYKSSRDEFNTIMSRILRERGWKGMLHSPHRYQEYELRMFDPYDVMHIDKRAVAKYSTDNPMQSQAVQRLREIKDPLMREHEAVTSGKPKSLGEFYRDITREELLGQPKLTRDPRAVKLEMHQDALIKSYPTEVETFLPSDWKKLPKDELLNDIKGIYGEGSPKEQFLKPWVEQYFEDMNKIAKDFMKKDKAKADEKTAWASFKNTMGVLTKKIQVADDFMSKAEKAFGEKLKELGPDGAIDYLHQLVNPYM